MPADMFGTEIQAGDLVVSAGVLGTVKNINGWGSINVRYPSERKVYAYEEGAPDIPYEHRSLIWNRETRQYERSEPETRYQKDYREVGTKKYNASQTRVSTDSIVVLRKHDGSVPQSVAEIFALHEAVFPFGGVKDGD